MRRPTRFCRPHSFSAFVDAVDSSLSSSPEPWLVPLLTHELLNELAVTRALLQLLRTSLAREPAEAASAEEPRPYLPPSATPDHSDHSEAAWQWLRRLEDQVDQLQRRARVWPLLYEQLRHPPAQPCALEKVLQEVQDRLGGEAAARRIRFEVQQWAGNECWVEGSLPLLTEALVCLVRNAVQFSPPGSAVRLRLAQLGAHCHLWIEDEGPGVPSWLLERPFRPNSVDAGSSRPGGHGWGLKLAHRVLSQASGYLRLFNRPHRGATAYVRLPAIKSL
ncbi:MAG: hypothetical protein IMX01_00675 [Limnochordaceae bacterium]|nr:hypothetical protein [Limnochordaceae bacterium]